MPNETTLAPPIPKSRGWRRYRELRKQDEADKREIERGLLDGLGRAPTMADKLAAEQIGALTVWARTLERRGRLEAAAEVRDQITRTQRATNFKPAPIAPKPKPTSIDDVWPDMEVAP